ncbi:type II and III secretion system protein [candidate division KSB1 bacterium]|nr:type II and III secretion system protein [candidate division KSB1 bacterium]
MNLISNFRYHSYLISMLLLVAFLQPGLRAQEGTYRNYAPEEYISLNRDLTLDAALEIINQLSQKYENRLILDPEERKSKIGVVVDNMHWKRALEYILRSNLLRYETHPRHYEVIPMTEQKATPQATEKVTFGTREIEIKAIFFEADQQTLSEIGIDWSTLKDGKVKIRIDSKNTTSVTEEIFSVAGRFSAAAWEVSSLIKTLETCNKGQVIATPQIRIMEDESGKIKVGKNFFLTTKDFAGNTRYSEYESGTILTVLPKVIKKGRFAFIHLEITAEKSDVVPSSVGVTKKITEGKTQVLLLNGEETAIAGLFSNEIATVRKGVPILKDMPWWFMGLRFVFGYNSQQITKKELIILIKARIVPSLVSRLKTKITRQNYLLKSRKEFKQQMDELKKR